jgi:peptidoglycan-associated lipoprotein
MATFEARRFAGIAAALILAACATKEAPPPMTTSSTSPPAPAASRAAPVVATAPRERPAPTPQIIPGSAKDFEINVGDRVFFAFDRTTLDQAARATLQKQATWLARYPGVTLKVEGDCDERGTREYNLALGARRAEEVKDYLVTLGVAPARLTTISYGKERPVCVESNEACWSKNRRAVSVPGNTAGPNVAMRD